MASKAAEHLLQFVLYKLHGGPPASHPTDNHSTEYTLPMAIFAPPLPKPTNTLPLSALEITIARSTLGKISFLLTLWVVLPHLLSRKNLTLSLSRRLLLGFFTAAYSTHLLVNNLPHGRRLAALTQALNGTFDAVDVLFLIEWWVFCIVALEGTAKLLVSTVGFHYLISGTIVAAAHGMVEVSKYMVNIPEFARIVFRFCVGGVLCLVFGY